MLRFSCWNLALAGLALGVMAPESFAQPNPAVKRKPDITKTVMVERPAANLLAGLSAAAPPAADPVNPRVPPGKVRWHRDLAAACAAARTSHKPVLVFHMMGKLDDRFC